MALVTTDVDCNRKCREEYQRCLRESRGRQDPGAERNCENKLNTCLERCRTQPPPDGGCKIDTDCPEGFKCNPESGKCYKSETPPPDDRLACYNGRCTPKSKIPDAESGKYSYTACDGKSEGADCGGTGPCKSDADCPDGRKCVDGRCEVTKVYCCKICEGNAVKKINSPNPCAAPYVRCDEFLDCGEDPDSGENPCETGGHLGKNVCDESGCRLLTPCEDGYSSVKNSKGRHWCCPEGGNGNGNGNGNGGEGCEGGYKKPEGEPCPSDFDTKAYGEVAWCCPKGEFEGEEFEWSKELQELLELLRGRFKDLLGYESPDVLGKLRPLLDKITGGAMGMLDYKSPDVMGKLGPVLDPLMKRMQYLYDYPRGLTPSERQEVINYAMKGMQRGERGKLQSSRDRLSRMGLLGSKFELREAGKIGRETKEGEADIRAKLAIDELDKRFQEIMGTTGMAAQLGQIPIGLEKWDAERIFKELIGSRALGTQMAGVPIGAEQWDAERIFNEMMGTTGAAQSMMGTFMGAETMPETLSAARRAEGQGMLDMLIRYLATMMGGQQSFLGPYMQAIMSQKTRAGGEGISNWLPYMMMMYS